MADDGAPADALVHSSAVYLYLYDAAAGQYAPQSDSVVGCALLAASATAFKLLFYHPQTKQPITSTPVGVTTKFTPQQNHYVNFYDASQKNYSMRFKDQPAASAFLRAVALAKAQALAADPTSYRDASSHVVLFDDLDMGKESSSGGVALGDIVGLAWKSWQGLQATNAAFFTPNPSDIEKKTPSEAIPRDGELKRVVLGDANEDDLLRAIGEGVMGMQKHGRRMVTVVLPASQQWFIGDIELVKVKKNKGGSITQQQQATAATHVPESAQSDDGASSNSSHDDLVHRMAALSRVGSKGPSLMADLSARSSLTSPDKPLRRMNSGGFSSDGSRRHSSIEDAIQHPGMVPVPLPGIVFSPDGRGMSSRRSSQQSIQVPASEAPQQRESVTAQVLATAHQSPEPVSYTPSPSFLQSSSYVSQETDSLMKEQSELDELKKKLEESKRRLEQQHNDPPTPSSTSTPSTSTQASSYTNSSFSSALTIAAPSSVLPPPFSTPSGLPNGFTPWQPSPSAFTPSFTPTIPRADVGGLPPFGSSSLLSSPQPSYGVKPQTPSSSGTVASPELENNIMRLQRSSNSIETVLHDLQSKMDRLLNMQSSSKASKYVPMSSSSGLYNSSIGGSAGSSLSSTSSSSSLLKNLEKALAQRDQLQELNARLQDHKDQMESTIEELQNQQESLQLENRNLLEKLQNGSHMQQEKFRMELRSVEQQLSHTQQQMMAYQEENLRLRQELAAKDEQVAKEKTQVQDEARKQLEQLQRQLQVQVHQESKDTLERLQAEKLRGDKQLSDLNAQKTQVEIERDSLASQVRVLQSQQAQWADERAQVQSQQDSRAKELHAQLQQAGVEMANFKQQLEKYRSENRQLIEMVETKEQQMAQLQQAKTQQEYTALSELLKEFMNDIYFHFQDAFEEDAEYTGKEIVTAIRKILKQNTMEILSKLEEFWHQQHQDA